MQGRQPFLMCGCLKEISEERKKRKTFSEGVVRTINSLSAKVTGRQRQRLGQPRGSPQRKKKEKEKKGCHSWQSVAVQTPLVRLVTRGIRQPEDLLVRSVAQAVFAASPLFFLLVIPDFSNVKHQSASTFYSILSHPSQPEVLLNGP